MKKFAAAVIVVALAVSSASAQPSFSAIGANLGTNFLVGDSPIVNSRLAPNLGVYGIYDLSSRLRLKLQVGYGRMTVVSSGANLTTSMLPVELIGMYSLPKMGAVSPFLHLGFGAFNFSLNSAGFASKRYSDGMFIGGAGFQYPLSEKLSLLATADMRLTTGDDFNGYTGGLPDGYFNVQAGISYSFKKAGEFRRETKPEKGKLIVAQKESGKGKKGTRAQKEDVYLQLVQLRSKIEQLQNELQNRDAQLQELQTLVKVKDSKIKLLESQIAEYKLMSPGLAPETQTAQKQSKAPQAPAARTAIKDVRRHYKIALQNFNSRHYRAAISELENLYANFPNHRLASNFVYWIGESYYALGNYEEAVKSFSKVLQYRHSPKLDDALLMAGLSYLKLGQPDQAGKKFQELLNRFPKSEYAGKARRYLQSIQRNVIS